MQVSQSHAIPKTGALHRCHFGLLIDFTDIQSYKVQELSEVPRYDQVHHKTPLLYLLKVRPFYYDLYI
jgi:hypothetical protein